MRNPCSNVCPHECGRNANARANRMPGPMRRRCKYRDQEILVLAVLLQLVPPDLIPTLVNKITGRSAPVCIFARKTA